MRQNRQRFLQETRRRIVHADDMMDESPNSSLSVGGLNLTNISLIPGEVLSSNNNQNNNNNNHDDNDTLRNEDDNNNVGNNDTDNNNNSNNSSEQDNIEAEVTAATNALTNGNGPLSTEHALQLITVLKSSQSVAPLIALVLFKLLHEYALPISSFCLFIVIRIRLDRRFSEILKNRTDMNLGGLVGIIFCSSLIVYLLFLLDYSHTGCYLILHPPPPPLEMIHQSETIKSSSALSTQLYQRSDEFRLFWVLATAFRVDLVAQCFCIGLKAFVTLLAQFNFNINNSRSSGQESSSLISSCFKYLLIQYHVLNNKIQKFIEDQSRMNNNHHRNRGNNHEVSQLDGGTSQFDGSGGGGGGLVEDGDNDDDTTMLLPPPSSSSSPHLKVRGNNGSEHNDGAAAEIVEDKKKDVNEKIKEIKEKNKKQSYNEEQDDDLSSNNQRKSSGFANHRRLKRLLCLIESIVLLYRVILPTLIWCRYYGGMASWAETVEKFWWSKPKEIGIIPFLRSWFTWVITGEVTNIVTDDNTNEVGNNLIGGEGGGGGGNDLIGLNNGIEEIDVGHENIDSTNSSSNSNGDTDTSFLKFLFGNNVTSSGYVFIFLYLSIKCMIIAYYFKRMVAVFKALFPPSQCIIPLSMDRCHSFISSFSSSSSSTSSPTSSLSPSSSSSRTHFDNFGSRILFYFQQCKRYIFNVFQCFCCCFMSSTSSTSTLLNTSSYGVGRFVTPDEVIEAGTPHCPICFETLENPVSLDPCGHLFCEDCACEWLDVERSCPMCRSSVAVEEDSDTRDLFKSLHLSSGETTFSLFIM